MLFKIGIVVVGVAVIGKQAEDKQLKFQSGARRCCIQGVFL